MDTGIERFSPKVQAAVRDLEHVVAELSIDADRGRPEVSVYLFGDEQGIGFRIAEISCWWPHPDSTPDRPRGGGVSFMRSDGADCGAVLLCAEDFVLCHGHPVEEFGPDDVYDPENESRWRLAWAFTDGLDLSQDDRDRIARDVMIPRKELV